MNNSSTISNSENAQFVSLGAHKLHYLKIGDGPLLVLAFLGYGNDASLFNFLAKPDYTIISFDMPLQGKSEGDATVEISKDQLCSMVVELMNLYNVHHVYLVGFSMGARFCLCIAEQMPKYIRNMVLIAADGLKPNHFYNFLTKTKIGLRLFRGFVNKGEIYMRLFTLLKRLKFLNKSKYKFIMQYIGSIEERALLFNIWSITKQLMPNIPLIVKNSRKYKVPIHLVMGAKDKVIPLRKANAIKKKHSFIHFHLFQRGHGLLRYPEVKGTVASWLLGNQQNSGKQ